MSAPFNFEHRVEFLSDISDETLRAIPAAPGVFALRGPDPQSEPYLTRAADLRRRLRRLLAPPEALDDQGRPILSKRLNLRERVRWIEWTCTGSDFESTIVLYCASREAFGAEEARRRLRLHAPYMLRVTMSHEHPRVYTTNRLSKRSLDESFGPFPSRAAAERYCDAVLDLFQFRRCYEDLAPYPEHPGCVYGEMNKCMRPCQQGSPTACTPGQYAAEAQRVFAFFRTRGQSLLDEVSAQREAASEAMDFEAAAALHKHWEKVRAASLLADELVRPVADLRAVVVQETAPRNDEPRTEDAAVFLLNHGHLTGPQRLSTLGVRAVREQTAVGSSLFAQPLMLTAIPLEAPSSNTVILSEGASLHPAPGTDAVILNETSLHSRDAKKDTVILSEGAELHPAPQSKDPEVPNPAPPADAISTTTLTPLYPLPSIPYPLTSLTPEDRARAVLTHLSAQTETDPDIAELCDALSLFRRWYYRPEKQRTGEVFLPNPDHSWPIRRILNGAARIVLGPPTAAPPVDREAAKTLKTKIIHAGREGVEREVPVLPKRPRTRKAITPSDVSS